MKQERAILTRYVFKVRHLWPGAIDDRTHRAQGNRVKQLNNCILEGYVVLVRSSNQIAKYEMTSGWPVESRVFIDLVLDWNSRDDSSTHHSQFQADLNAALSGSKFSALPLPSGVLTPYGLHTAVAFSHPRQISMDREVFDLVERFNHATGLSWKPMNSLREVNQQTYLKIKGKWEPYSRYLTERAKRAETVVAG